MNKVIEGQIFKNYKELCSYLGEPVKTGCAKMSQLSEWERYFSYHKEGNKFVVDTVYDVPKEKENNYCGNNIKNIKPMIEYIQGKWNDDDYYSLTDWYCNQLGLMDKDTCNICYMGSEEIDAYCKSHNITNSRLLCKYISLAKSEMKNLFVKALSYMEKKNLAEYSDGYKFIYQLGKRTKGYVVSDRINEVIKYNETVICNDMNVEHNLSDKLVGRQNLLVIYGQEHLTEQFNDLKVKMLMADDNVIGVLNEEVETQHETYVKDCNSISDDRKIIAYNRVIAVTSVECKECDLSSLGMEICNIVRDKVRKQLAKEHYANKYTGEIIYPFEECYCGSDMDTIERLLFQFVEEKPVVFDDMSDIDEIFGRFKTIDDYSMVDIVDLPAMSEVHEDLTKAAL